MNKQFLDQAYITRRALTSLNLKDMSFGATKCSNSDGHYLSEISLNRDLLLKP